MKGISNDKIPREIYGEGAGHNSVHAAVLQAGLTGLAQANGALSETERSVATEYFRKLVIDLVDLANDESAITAEAQLSGDHACIRFHDATEIDRNGQLDSPDVVSSKKREELLHAGRASNDSLVIQAVKTAIRLRNKWFVQEGYIKRVRAGHQPVELGIGIHYGRTALTGESRGRQATDGQALGLAKDIQSFAASGIYSRIFVSRQVYDVVDRIVVQHSQLRQRIHFTTHPQTRETSDSLADVHPISELRSYHRIGIHCAEEDLARCEELFWLDNSHYWAYLALIDYYAYERGDWDKAFELAQAAHLAHPAEDKVLYDLAQYHLEHGDFPQSARYAEEAIKHNESFDLAHEHLATVAAQTEDLPRQISHLKRSVGLSPDSAVNNFNLGLALLCADEPKEGQLFVKQALQLYPEYRDWPVFQESLETIRKLGKLPDSLEKYAKA